MHLVVPYINMITLNEYYCHRVYFTDVGGDSVGTSIQGSENQEGARECL